LWLNLKAYDADSRLVYESGAYNPETAVLTEDPALKVYESKQGLTPALAGVVGLPAGESFHFVLNNTVIKDNRIPPRGYTIAAFDQPGLRPVGATYADGQYWDDTLYSVPAETVRVETTLYYQTASKEYIDFLRTKGGADGATLGLLWDTLKSPPEVIATASATDLVLTPSQDNTLYEHPAGALSNGAGQHLFAGRTSQPSGSIRRGLLAFDLSAIPTGSTILSVTLRLNLSRAADPTPQPVVLHRLLASWGESGSDAPDPEGSGGPAAPGDATWTHRFTNTLTWTTPGGDFVPAASASTPVGPAGVYTWGSTPQLVADVQAWLDEPTTNFGWLLQGNESIAGTVRRFDSRENGTVANRPMLTIVFAPPGKIFLPLILK
jgi:hypothetical protein